MPDIIILAENKEGAQLDALARRRSRIDESRMRSSARHGAVVARIEAHEQQNFVRPHFRRIEPALGWIVGEIVGLAAPIAINEFGGDKVFRSHGVGVAHCERRIEDRRSSRLLLAVLQELVKQIAVRARH
jgi:hypothetical protein